MKFGNSKAAVVEVDACADPRCLFVFRQFLVYHIHEGLILLVRDVQVQKPVDGLDLCACPENDGV